MAKKAINGVEARTKQRKDPLDSSRNDTIVITVVIAMLAFGIIAATYLN